jgi:transposase
MIPEVLVPPVPVRELRTLIAHRQRLMSQQTAAKNRLQAVVYRNTLIPPKDGLFTEKSRTWWNELALPASERLRVQHNLDTIAHLSVQIAEAEQELALLSVSEQWFNGAALLIQLSGIGMIGAMTILSAVGNITRFPSAKQLVGYAGLGGKVHASGKTHRGGGITKQGRPELRYTMVEAAWTAVRYYPFWQTRYERLARRIGEMKAITT